MGLPKVRQTHHQSITAANIGSYVRPGVIRPSSVRFGCRAARERTRRPARPPPDPSMSSITSGSRHGAAVPDPSLTSRRVER